MGAPPATTVTVLARLRVPLLLQQRRAPPCRRPNATGNLTLRPNSVVESVLYDEKRDRATGVRVIDGDTRKVLEFRARVIFLCASALESSRILLNSRTRRFRHRIGELERRAGTQPHGPHLRRGRERHSARPRGR